MKRSSGVLLPLYALPAPYGIGTLGESAYKFIDFLKASGQSFWQMLPLGFTDAAGSPYSSVSSFAGNPAYIDLDLLAEEGLIDRAELSGMDFGGDGRRVDIGRVAAGREKLLRQAFMRGREKYAGAVAEIEGEAFWLRGFALYMALKRRFGGAPWYEWTEDIRARRPEAAARWESLLAEDIQYCEFTQALFFGQLKKLRAYARENNVRIIGDIPIYVALDSADVWMEPQFFRLDGQYRPLEVAGVPPDYFSEEGQLWGNPLYDWDRMRSDGWGFWIRRVDGASKLYDVMRIDHFRAFSRYWAVPYGEKTAKNGMWREGPGISLLSALQNWFPEIELIAEDLGVLTPDVGELREAAGLPGMKVLEFAFAPDGSSDYLPHKYERRCVCYAGTHDNNTILGWLRDAPPGELEFAERYLAINREEGWCWGMLRGGMSSVADLYICQMQDLIGLDGGSRTNTPGTVGGNFAWRMLRGEASAELSEKLLAYTKMYGRA